MPGTVGIVDSSSAMGRMPPGLKADGISVPVIYITGNENPKPFSAQQTDRAAQESIGSAFIGSITTGKQPVPLMLP